MFLLTRANSQDGWMGEYQLSRPRLAGIREHLVPMRFGQIEELRCCPNCRSIGVIVWDEEDQQRSLVRLPDSFDQQRSDVDPCDIELVCRACGTSQAF